MTVRIAVLASGRGSNLLAILQAIAAGTLDADVVGVFSDKPDAPALHHVPTDARWSRDAKAFPDRASFDAELADAVAASRPDWIVCAGYMRILGEAFVQRFRGRLLNIHPSLLPKYRGLRTHLRALLAGDTPETLAARVLQVEHPLLVAALQLTAAGRMSEQDGVAWRDGQPMFTPLRLPFPPQ